MPVSDDIGRQTVDTTSLLFVASRDEPNGIPDDFFLLRALNKLNGNISYQFRLWTDMSEPDDNQYTSPPPPPQQVIIRSLWEGRTRQGSSPKLLQFFTETALRCPQMRYDYWLLDWTAHKSYLLQLAHANVKIVPSCLILASNVTNQGVSQFLPHIDTIESSPGGIKRAMLAHGWAEAILKPAVGTRCEGVMRLSLKCWTLSMAFRVASLLKDGDCILQPFLPPVACTLPAPSSTSAPARQTPPIIDGTANIHDPPLLGELCVLCIQGEITHAVHKNPILWGWHESSCLCSGSVLDLERVNSSCTCKATLAQSTRHHSVVSNLTLLPARSDVSPDLPEEVANLLKRAPVDRVLLPLPAAVVTTVHQVLDIIRDKRYFLFC